jgi:hypothetical protein
MRHMDNTHFEKTRIGPLAPLKKPLYSRIVLHSACSFPPETAGEAMRSAGDMPQIIVSDNDNFLGHHTFGLGDIKDPGEWGNSISSIIILLGAWDFFDDENFAGTKMATLGPGM